MLRVGALWSCESLDYNFRACGAGPPNKSPLGFVYPQAKSEPHYMRTMYANAVHVIKNVQFSSVPLNEVRHGDPPVISTTVSVTVASETARGGLPWPRPPSPQPLPSVAAWETLCKAEAHPHRPQPPRSVARERLQQEHT